MKFSYNWLQDYIPKKLPKPDKLAELLMFHSFEVEGVEKRGNDWALDISILANRAPDCLSHIGIAREIAAILKSKIKSQKSKIKIKNQKSDIKNFIDIFVKNKNECPRYTATIIESVKAGDSPKWLKERLETCGLQSINNAVDAVNYVMLETGQPMHAFDLDKIKGRTIFVRRAKRGEEIEALDNQTYKLDEDILVIADAVGPLAVAGIKGGKRAEIDGNTKNIVFEAANFDRLLTRRASRKLKLKTDASWRFENGLSPSLIDFSQERACGLIQEIAGGQKVKGMVDTNPKKPPLKKIKLDVNYLNNLLGIKIPIVEIKKILSSLGFGLQVTSYKLQVTIPEWRLDINLQEDLIEEVGRIWGYNKINSVFPTVSLSPPKRNDNLFWTRLCREALKEQGFCEIYNYSFLGDEAKEIFGAKEESLTRLENPISAAGKYMRQSQIPGLLKTAKENLKNFKIVKIFELGKIFVRKDNFYFREKKMLSGSISGGMGDEIFYEMKGTLEILFSAAGIADFWCDEVKATPEDSPSCLWHQGKTAEIKSGQEKVGFMGEIHPLILDKVGIKERVFAFDIDFEKLTTLSKEEHEYEEISQYPSAVRDLSVAVPSGAKTADIMNVIYRAGGRLVHDVDLFDVYVGEEIGDGRENFAFHIIYHSQEKTLTGSEIDAAHQKIIKALETNPSWQVRK